MNAPTKKEALASICASAQADTDTAVNTAPVSFTTGGYDVTLTVPVHHAFDYALLKAEQIAALNRLISDRLSGCDVQITENELWLFAELASEMSHQTVELFSRAKDARDYPKGGV